MGRRRVLTALLALVLAVTGTVLLTRYVRGADERALAGAAATRVLVVTRAVPQGTSVADLAGRVETRSLPAVAVAPGTLSSLAESSGQVTAVDLQPGEQLLASRLVDPASLVDPTQVPVPAGLQELTVALDSQRVLGGALVPGDHVGVLVALTKDDLQTSTATMTASEVLVVRLGAAAAGAASSGAARGGTLAAAEGSSSGDLTLVTLAVDSQTAAKIVFGVDAGDVWLTRQPAGLPSTVPTPITRKDVER